MKSLLNYHIRNLGLLCFAAAAPVMHALAAVPAAPTNFCAVDGSSAINLSWTAVASATSYDIYRGTYWNGEGATPVKTGLTGTTYTDPDLTNGTTYYYELTAVNSSGTSAFSNQPQATPSVNVFTNPNQGTNQGMNVNSSDNSFWCWALNADSDGPNTLTRAWNDGPTNYDFTFYTHNGDNLVSVGPLWDYFGTCGRKLSVLTTGTLQFSVAASVDNFNPNPPSLDNTWYVWSIYAWTNPTIPPPYSTGNVYANECYIIFNTNCPDFTGPYYTGTLGAPLGSVVAGTGTFDCYWSSMPWGAPGQNQYVAVCRNQSWSASVDAAPIYKFFMSNTTHKMTDGYIMQAGWTMETSGSAGSGTVHCKNVVCPLMCPLMPTDIVVHDGTNQIGVSWEASESATSYNLYRATTSGGEGDTPYKAGLATTSYADTEVTEGTTYYYTVASVNASGTSNYYDEVSGSSGTTSLWPAAYAPYGTLGINGNTWSFGTTASGNGYALLINGTTTNGTGVAVYNNNGSAIAANASMTFYGWSAGAWGLLGGNGTPPWGMTLKAAAVATTGTLTLGINTWTFGGDSQWGYALLCNGYGYGCGLVLYQFNGTLDSVNPQGTWSQWNGSAWSAITPPTSE